MVRQITISDPPAAPSGSDAHDLGNWLTRDLRPKGTPLPARPPTEPPPALGVPPEREALADWLRQDLRPKNSTPPRAAQVPLEEPRASLPPAAGGFAVVPPNPVSPFALAAPQEREQDEWEGLGVGASLPPLPDAMEEAEPLLAAEPEPPRAIAAALPDAALPDAAEPDAALRGAPPEVLPSSAPRSEQLDDDDLSVLPGRRKTRQPGRRKRGVVLLALLLLAGLLVGVGWLSRRGPPPVAGTDAAAANADVAAALPPPPSAAALPEPTPEPEAARAPRARGGGSAPAPEEPGLADPRSFLGGPNTRRYADVPSPTLSRLANEQRKRARQREEAARAAKGAKPASP